MGAAGWLVDSIFFHVAKRSVEQCFWLAPVFFQLLRENGISLDNVLSSLFGFEVACGQPGEELFVVRADHPISFGVLSFLAGTLVSRQHVRVVETEHLVVIRVGQLVRCDLGRRRVGPFGEAALS